MMLKEDNIFEISAAQFEQFVKLPAVRHIYECDCIMKSKFPEVGVVGLEGRTWFKFNDIVYVVAQ